MSHKRGKKKNVAKKQKTPKNKKTLMLKLDNGAEIPAKIAYMKDTKCFKINEIDINKIRVSEKKVYDDNEYILLIIILKDVTGYYSVYNDSKKMNFSVNNEPYDKLNDILEHIYEKLEIIFDDFTFLKNDGE